MCRLFLVYKRNIRRCSTISRDSLRINEEIHIREVRVTSATGEQLGIMPTREALRMAEEQHLDLVEVAPKAKPPVCRIMDFGKYRYEQQKREKEAKKKQKVISIKEVKLRPNIEQHDFDVKLKNALRFVEEGNKVKVTIMFRGRELSHPELGKEVLSRVAEKLGDSVSIERNAKLEGKNMTMIVAPKVQKASKPKKSKETQSKEENSNAKD
ncbi:translation initiation factor IF-3 [Selenomonas sp. GACV-9]|nr:translation initiation factor IF-3 [Selenomonas ruminantium]